MGAGDFWLPWDQQPGEAAELELPSAFAFNAANPAVNLATGELSSGIGSSGDLQFRPGIGGIAAYSAGDNQGRLWTGISTGVDYTLLALVRDHVGTGTQRFILNADIGATTNRIFQLSLTNVRRLNFTAVSTGPTYHGATSTIQTDPDKIHVLAARLSANTLSVWIDGVMDGTATLTGTPRSLDPTKQMFVGVRATTEMQGDIYSARIIDGALSDEVLSAINSPEAYWAALFAPRLIWGPVASAGGPPTLCLASGTLTHKTPTGSDLRLFMSAAGDLIASTTQPASTRPVSLGAGGQLQAGLSS